MGVLTWFCLIFSIVIALYQFYNAWSKRNSTEIEDIETKSNKFRVEMYKENEYFVQYKEDYLSSWKYISHPYSFSGKYEKFELKYDRQNPIVCKTEDDCAKLIKLFKKETLKEGSEFIDVYFRHNQEN